MRNSLLADVWPQSGGEDTVECPNADELIDTLIAMVPEADRQN